MRDVARHIPMPPQTGFFALAAPGKRTGDGKRPAAKTVGEHEKAGAQPS